MCSFGIKLLAVESKEGKYDNNHACLLFFHQGDSKLDFSAEMYHYHQTKSQLSAMEK